MSSDTDSNTTSVMRAMCLDARHVCLSRVLPHTLTHAVLIHRGVCPATHQLPRFTQSGPVQLPDMAEGP